MYNRVFNCFVENKPLFPKQFTFSNEQAILELVRNITKSFEKFLYVLGVFIDLKKEFDKVNHEILLHKLTLYRINGTSYCSSQNQCIIYETMKTSKNLYTKISYVVCPRDPSRTYVPS